RLIAVRPPADATMATAVVPLSARLGIAPEQQLAERSRGPLGFLPPLLVPDGEFLVSPSSHPLDEPRGQLGTLLECAQRHPERILGRLRLRVDQAVGPEGVAHPAAEA